MAKDWIGNKHSTFSTIGASNYSLTEREKNDFYATSSEAVEKLCKVETFDGIIWENACGVGSISEVLVKNGYKTFNTDIINRGYGKQNQILDFLKEDLERGYSFNIVTNPPYKYAKEFVERGCGYLSEGKKMALLLKLTFLEGQERQKMFKKYPPERIHVFSKRITCAMNADWDKYKESGAVAYGWYVWTYDNLLKKNNPVIDWI